MSGSRLYGDRVPTAREQRVIELVAKGSKNKEVGDVIGKSEDMVKNYLRVIYDKLVCGTELNWRSGMSRAEGSQPRDATVFRLPSGTFSYSFVI
jgi:hypothetical protein